jgi:hypothetical protein
MKPQVPAEGILKTHEWGTSKMYKVVCQCGNDDDAVEFEIEADESGVSLTTYTTQKTDWWSTVVEKRYDIDNPWFQEFDSFWKDLWNGFVTRLRLTKNIWWNGYVEYQSTTIMSKQQALNYADTLKSAINDVEEFQKKNRSKETLRGMREANEQDCV